MTENYLPLPEWVTGHRMAVREDDGSWDVVSTGERGDYVTSWTGRTEEIRFNSDGTRRQEDLDHQPEEIHRPVLELVDGTVAGQFMAVLDNYVDGELIEFRGRNQVFVAAQMTTSKYLALLEGLDAAGLLAEGVLEGAYADGFTVAALRDDVQVERPGVEEV